MWRTAAECCSEASRVEGGVGSREAELRTPGRERVPDSQSESGEFGEADPSGPLFVWGRAPGHERRFPKRLGRGDWVSSSWAMLCYAMLCYAMLCYAMLCYAMLCYAMLCYAMLCYATTRAVQARRDDAGQIARRGPPRLFSQLVVCTFLQPVSVKSTFQRPSSVFFVIQESGVLSFLNACLLLEETRASSRW